MKTEHSIVIFEGDYAGPEVMSEGIKVLREVERQQGSVHLNLKYHKIGGSAFDEYGVSITEEGLADAISADAVLLGAVGGPKWSKNKVPVEWGLGDLRKALDAFGNLRPVKFASPSLVELSSLKPERCSGTDIIILRELTGGIYYGKRREHDNLDWASDTEAYTRGEVERIARLAGTLAMSSDPPRAVISLDKANVLAACGRFWRAVVTEVIENEFPELKLEHMLIDSASMVMASNPTRLNGVVLTSNMFGDIISDQASAIPGSLGLLPSASLCAQGLGDLREGSSVRGLYEPIHGTAPDIAGKGVVNPAGMILSVALMFRYSLNMPDAADAIEKAVKSTLESKVRTRDLGGTASTAEFGNAVVAALAKRKSNGHL
ncbi:3-isopropylmalate dehydrogenase-like protein [Periconia macrospinosa]|uniref:3-isopropylmalate dehydrogenase n=1 Tax=Periconia macrospinosa TaxID=97972 RepID=A0A2V1DAJ7_9PLEO|nr:3-isopropylmalate dehydrogenase-like protein [Periconia macrospinosa]